MPRSLERIAARAEAMVGQPYPALKSWDVVLQCVADCSDPGDEAMPTRVSPIRFKGFVSDTHPLVKSRGDMWHVPRGALLAFIEVDLHPPVGLHAPVSTAPRHLIHAMISLGEGKAAGINNMRGIGVGRDGVWEIIDLYRLLNWYEGEEPINRSDPKAVLRDIGFESVSGMPSGVNWNRPLRIRYRCVPEAASKGINGFRRRIGIVSDKTDPTKDADVIMTAVTLGFAASYIQQTGKPIQFDIDPLEVAQKENEKGNPEAVPRLTDDGPKFESAVRKLGDALAGFLDTKESQVKAGTTPAYIPGSVIIGIYRPRTDDGISEPMFPDSVLNFPLSKKGRALYERIYTATQIQLPQYVGRGAYTGFMDNNNSPGDGVDTDPIGPMSTQRFEVPTDVTLMPSRWLPSDDSAVWTTRKRVKRGNEPDSWVAWGLIGGESANQRDGEFNDGDSNKADETTLKMRGQFMKFNDKDVLKERKDGVAAYTHGLVQSIYKAYHLGPSCVPYEIAVGGDTTKIGSCLPCALFSYAAGYPTTSIHLGRGESWSPLFVPPDGDSADPKTQQQQVVIKSLNASWFSCCNEWLRLGLKILEGESIADDHKESRDAVLEYLDSVEPNVAGVLILDALTIHSKESDRINRTLKARPKSA